MKIPPLFSLFIGFLCFAMPSAWAGQPTEWQIDFQEAASPVMERLTGFHDLLLIIITVITIFVTILLAYVCWRFSAKRNPNPSKTTHHTLLEIVWTTIPVIILLIIAIPSFRNLYYIDRAEDADMTLKIVAHQWYWEYEYPDHDSITFDSYMLKDDELKDGQPRLLSVDNQIVLPVGKTVRVLVTSADVIHNWAMPSMGIKVDAVPGRLNETWLRVDRPGTYYGQCSELCGVLHGFMPIAIKAVSEEEFAAWVESAKEEFADNGINEKYVASLSAY